MFRISAGRLKKEAEALVFRAGWEDLLSFFLFYVHGQMKHSVT